MIKINDKGYVIRGRLLKNKHPRKKYPIYDWFFVKDKGSAYITIDRKFIILPKKYIGKKIKIKIEEANSVNS